MNTYTQNLRDFENIVHNILEIYGPLNSRQVYSQVRLMYSNKTLSTNMTQKQVSAAINRMSRRNEIKNLKKYPDGYSGWAILDSMGNPVIP